jgi:hypothetical protein
MKKLKCDMQTDCKKSVTHIDNKGFVYCQWHGNQRNMYKPCRKLTQTELKKLENGETIKY